jgi:hypothetical protein
MNPQYIDDPIELRLWQLENEIDYLKHRYINDCRKERVRKIQEDEHEIYLLHKFGGDKVISERVIVLMGLIRNGSINMGYAEHLLRDDKAWIDGNPIIVKME